VEQTIQTLAVRVEKLEKDTAELFEKTNTATVTLAAVNEKLSSMLTTLGEVKQAIEEMRRAPQRRLEAIFRAVVTAFVSGLAGYFIAKFK
jgi:uncharacterized protein YoxC